MRYQNILRCALSLGLYAVVTATYAAPYPDRPITVVVPQAAGGASDVVSRIVLQKIGSILNQSIVVENRPGAGGNIGISAVARAPADGYTLLFNVSSAHLINPYLYSEPGFSPERDFAPVSPFGTGSMLLVAAPDFPPNNIQELLALAKAKPNEITYASAGNGTLNHLMGEVFNKSAKVEMMHVPYRGAAAATTDVMSGRVSVAFQAVASSISQVKAGKLKVLAIASTKRLPDLPGVPTIGESIPGYGEDPWYGLFAPAKTPVDVLDKLSQATQKALEDEGVRRSLAAQGVEPYFLSRAEFAKLIGTELPRWENIVKDSGAKVD